MTDTQTDDRDVKQVVKEHWGNRAPTFDDAPHHAIHGPEQREAWLSVLRRITGDQPRRTLDIGCGTGFLTLLLAELGHDADGIDIAPAMLERARAKAAGLGLRSRFLEGDAESLPVPDESYDLAVERHVIWTLPNPDAALREWRRVLRPGGRVALVEGAWRRSNEVQPDYQPIHHALPLYGGRPAPVLADLLTAAGFDDIAVEPLLDPELWGGEMREDRYVIAGVRA